MSQTLEVAAAEQARMDTRPAVLADIYQQEVNLAVWQAGLSAPLRLEVQTLCQQHPSLKLATSGTPDELLEELSGLLTKDSPRPALMERLQLCLSMYADLFEPAAIGLRLDTLDRAMCPRLHVDRLAVRMVTTFCGPATQWLPNDAADRSWLGAAGAGQPDETSGLMRDPTALQSLQAGDVALMKGEGWEGNQGLGLIHRSPAVPTAQRRLVLTLDWVS